jgi:YHS domain-containing protein
MFASVAALSRRSLLLGVMLIAATSFAGAEPVNRSRAGLALDGYDPAAYFTDGRAVRGSAAHAHVHEGTTYHFASAAHRDAFAAEPARYLPQYGGFCAWAVSRGYTAPTDPLAWRIVDGRLFLNYSRSVQRTWEQDAPGNIRKGDANWPGLKNKS